MSGWAGGKRGEKKGTKAGRGLPTGTVGEWGVAALEGCGGKDLALISHFGGRGWGSLHRQTFQPGGH
jgi:hypothetical protein